jgi:hypothetical protein
MSSRRGFKVTYFKRVFQVRLLKTYALIADVSSIWLFVVGWLKGCSTRSFASRYSLVQGGA